MDVDRRHQGQVRRSPFTTGPPLFANAGFQYFSYVSGNPFTHLYVMSMTSPILVANTPILPTNTFGSGQLLSKSGTEDEESAFAENLLKGSWEVARPMAKVE